MGYFNDDPGVNMVNAPKLQESRLFCELIKLNGGNSKPKIIVTSIHASIFEDHQAIDQIYSSVH